jgi:putative DNA primase/helicase
MLVAKNVDIENPLIRNLLSILFKNTAFNLLTGNFYKVQKENYITQCSGFDYTPSTHQQNETVDDLFCKIFPDSEIKNATFLCFFLSLSGYHPEKLFLANGAGRNMKRLINELMFELIGDYAYKFSIEVLTKDVKNTGANTAIANVHKKRFVLANEPEYGCKLQIGICKELTGGNKISARGNKTKTLLEMFLIIECNQKPQINVRIDTSTILLI